MTEKVLWARPATVVKVLLISMATILGAGVAGVAVAVAVAVAGAGAAAAVDAVWDHRTSSLR